MGGRGENLIQLRHSLQLGHLHGALLHALRHAPGDGGVRGDPFLKPLFQKHVVVPIEAVGGAVVRLEVVPGGRRKRKKNKKETYLVKHMRDSSRRGTSYTTHTLTHVHTYCAEHCQAAISIASRRCSSASLLRTFWPWRNQVHGTGHLQPPSPFPLMVARTECTRAARARKERSKSEEGRRK